LDNPLYPTPPVARLPPTTVEHNRLGFDQAVATQDLRPLMVAIERNGNHEKTDLHSPDDVIVLLHSMTVFGPALDVKANSCKMLVLILFDLSNRIDGSTLWGVSLYG
jgi:hypothetical protein